MQPEQKKILMGYFFEESNELVSILEKGIANLPESLQDSQRLQELFCSAHSLKGGAAFLQIKSVGKMGFILEKCLGKLKDTPVEVDAKLQGLFIQALEFLKLLIKEMQSYDELPEEKMAEIFVQSQSTFEELIFYVDILILEKKLS